MKKAIGKYLAFKDPQSYSELDHILEMYVNGQIQKLLSGYEDVEISASVGKAHKYIRLEYKSQNIVASMEFLEDKYAFAVYPLGIVVEELDALLVDRAYTDDFNLKLLLKEVDQSLQNHPKRKDISVIRKEIKKLKKISQWLAVMTYVAVAIVVLYVLISGNPLYVDPHYALISVIPLAVSAVLNQKVHRLNKYLL